MNTQLPVNDYSRARSVNATEPDRSLYKATFIWLAVAFLVAAFGTLVIGPLVPLSMMMPLSIVTIIVLLASGFFRATLKAKTQRVLNVVLVLGIPLLLGITLYPAIAYYTSVNPSILVYAFVGTVVLFGAMAAWGAFATRRIYGISGILFGLVIAMIVLGLLNAFVFHLSVLALIISVIVLIIFCIYSYMDVQAMQDRAYGEDATVYALALFLDIINIFTSLLNILGFLNND